jgi:hypothetical protein
MEMAVVSGHGFLSELDALGWSCSDTPLLSPESVCELREIFFRLHRDTETGWHNTWNSVDEFSLTDLELDDLLDRSLLATTT